ncbi:unnamed protein product [Urochloa humidicola]
MQEPRCGRAWWAQPRIAIKFGKACSLRITVVSTSPAKEEAREGLNADDCIVSTNQKQMQAKMRSLDYIIDSIPVMHSLGPLLELFKVNGVLRFVELPHRISPCIELPSFPLVFGQYLYFNI